MTFAPGGHLGEEACWGPRGSRGSERGLRGVQAGAGPWLGRMKPPPETSSVIHTTVRGREAGQRGKHWPHPALQDGWTPQVLRQGAGGRRLWAPREKRPSHSPDLGGLTEHMLSVHGPCSLRRVHVPCYMS